MTDKNNSDKGLESLINQINKLYLDGKESTKEYKDLSMKMANYITKNNRASSYSIENDPNYSIDKDGNIHRK
jgi:hypothetical protein